MKTIWKFPIALVDLQTLSVPSGARFISVANQDGTICLWAEVDTIVPQERRQICVLGTGNPIPAVTGSRRFIGTVLQPPFVWHVFEVVRFGGEESGS